ncbi:hypothetical protein P0R33_03265 [Flavobacterium sp. YJ01]|uniref:hypothetical protein n=1 Tax=Flavobacterium sp. YJ01 TaxID=3031997 RepID=UPI0023E387BF|nr:hypothetical protein [Flavobacterium sp. YJ01]WET03358.1 hypothetical protein P0R33_03265 [Flavobacterium sp. YJ01]
MNTPNINTTTGLIHKDGKFIGSSVIFPWNGDLLCLTASHNLFGKKFDQSPDLQKWNVVDHTGLAHPILELVGNHDLAKEHDIIILKLDCKSALANFTCPKFCSIPKNPAHSLMFRGKYESSKTSVTHKKLTFNTDCDKITYHFLCDVDKVLLTNNTYSSGSDWLGGWSGSGLFIENHTELVCAGVMTEIPNKGDDGQIQFVSVNALSALNILGIELPIMDSEELNFDPTLNASSLEAIFDAIDEDAITEWENNDLNKPQLKYINDKLPNIYPEDQLEKNKRHIIKKLLLGKAYITVELRNNEQLFTLYKKAYRVYDLEDKNIYANNKMEARLGVSNIKNEYESYLQNCLGSVFSASDVKLLAFYGISEWIADCSLSILGNE